jgi:hypothetical protein
MSFPYYLSWEHIAFYTISEENLKKELVVLFTDSFHSTDERKSFPLISTK